MFRRHDPILATARREHRRVLYETEALASARELGLGVPRVLVAADARAAADLDLDPLPGHRVVVKVISDQIVHKSDVGGVVVVPKENAAIAAAVAVIAARLAGQRVAGFGVFEHAEHTPALGAELLLGMRWTPEFGPVVTLAPGGVYAEHLAHHLRPGSGTVILSPALARTPEQIAAALAGSMIVPVATGALRGQPALIERERLIEILDRCLRFAAATMPHEVAEFEINPLALGPRGAMALDALLRLGDGEIPSLPAPRPLHKLAHLLRPRSVAVVGVSKARNPGHVIIDNLLDEGFPKERLFVVKPGGESIEGCLTVPDLAALPERVDLLVLAVAAEQVPELLGEVIDRRAAESVILIPGGLGERAGSEALVAQLHGRLAAARASEWRGPVVNGGNCLGVRSVPGRCDTTFIPRHKLRYPRRPPAPLAVLSQSGAFAVARASRFEALNPRYLVSLGNQLDLTVGDYLEHLKDDVEVEVFAVYVEGFQPGDGLRFFETAAEITTAGKAVILYRAGRTPAGTQATASHTASIAGDYAATAALARQAGVVLAESLEDFDDLVRLFCGLRERRPAGKRLGALSNAGFECVAIADALGSFELRPFAPATVARLGALLERHHLGAIVAPHNPLDLTPILGDAAYEEAVRAVLDDPGIDLAVVGCVPLTGALATLPAGAGHAEDLMAEGSIVTRLGRLWRESEKPWVAVVDAGPLYDPMARRLEAEGVPTFRVADRALRLLGVWRVAASSS